MLDSSEHDESARFGFACARAFGRKVRRFAPDFMARLKLCRFQSGHIHFREKVVAVPHRKQILRLRPLASA
jgi:hypothetical protein